MDKRDLNMMKNINFTMYKYRKVKQIDNIIIIYNLCILISK